MWVLKHPLWFDLWKKDEEDRSCGLTSTHNNTIVWTETRGLRSQQAWSYWFFRWPGWDLYLCSCSRQTGPFPTKLTGWQWGENWNLMMLMSTYSMGSTRYHSITRKWSQLYKSLPNVSSFQNNGRNTQKSNFCATILVQHIATHASKIQNPFFQTKLHRGCNSLLVSIVKVARLQFFN